MTRRMVAYGVCVVILAMTASRADACTCLCEAVTVDAAIQRSSAIVVAEVTETIDQTVTIDAGGSEWMGSCGAELLRLSVRSVLKGRVPRQLVTMRETIGTGCDFQFSLEKDRQYLFFLRSESASSTVLNVDGCAPSRPLETAGELVEYVRTILDAKKEGKEH